MLKIFERHSAKESVKFSRNDRRQSVSDGLNRFIFLNGMFIFASLASSRGRGRAIAGNQSQFEQVREARNTLWLLSRM